jgi:hypothetical protein
MAAKVGSEPSRAMTDLISGPQGRYSALNSLRFIFYIAVGLMNQTIYVSNEITGLAGKNVSPCLFIHT